MDREPKYRWPLNKDQVEVLELLYRFRFINSDLLAKYFGKRDGSYVYKRLKILQDQGFIGKRFDSSYRIKGKPAAYFLLPTGARKLQAERGIEIKISSLYKETRVLDSFVQRCFDLFTIYLQLKGQYGDALKFFTKPELKSYEYFPKKLPDAYIRIKGEHERQFFLELFYEAQPFYSTILGRIKQYNNYAEDGGWEETGTEFPLILVVCDSLSLLKSLQKQMPKKSDLSFALAASGSFRSGAGVWQLSDNPAEHVQFEAIS